ncbi:hypothetical protein JFL47_11570 [Haemophilus haemoglobinophilus]|nr:hypothetical protein [Canicola haemoglobinophilus]MBN6711853.1 hypothetical protein [Canicola haemoglobinophilus]
MSYLLKKEDFILNESKYVSDYAFEDENIKVTIYKEDFTQEEIDFTNKLINLYEENLPKIALACVESDTFKCCYPEETIGSIVSKLGKPIFRRMGSTTLLTYTEHTIDYDHILDIEFEGLYEDFDIGIDG